MKGAIVSFKGEHRFLSNFYPVKIYDEIDDLTYNSTENYYQAQKTTNVRIRRMFRTLTASDAKAQGSTLDLRTDWESLKVLLMHTAINIKFDNEVLAKMLLNTKGYLLIEGNHWNDNFWGVDFKTGIGKNMLGNILMSKREILINKK